MRVYARNTNRKRARSPSGAAKGEASEIEEALRLLVRSGDEDRQLRVAILASFYPDLYRFAVALLIEARETVGLSQAELAARFGLPQQLVLSYESGARLLDVGEFVAICRAIGVDPYELLLKAERIADGSFAKLGSTTAEDVVEERGVVGSPSYMWPRRS